jgi:predicted enzyme related to lactoylglutathione lyase
MSAPIVFFDIAGPDRGVLDAFYSTLFGWDISHDGSFSTAVTSPTAAPTTLMGTIREDPPEKVFYIGVEDVSSKLAEIVEKGGSINQPRFEVPGVVVMGLFNDPAGNRVGLVEMENGKTKVP